MDIHGMQSMDWLFKKERIYLLAQFWQQRATLAEKEVSALKEQLAVANNQNQSDNKMAAVTQGTEEIMSRSNIELELSAKDKEISQLIEDVQRLQNSMGKLQENSANQIARLEEELEHKKQHICRLEARLEAQKDYSELKRQLSGLRKAEEMTSSTPEEPEKIKPVAESPIPKPPPTSTPADVQGDVPSLHNVETFGSFLGEEIVANWRRSLERTMVSQAARPTPPPASWPPHYEGKVKAEESREREGDKGVSPARELPLVNGASRLNNNVLSAGAPLNLNDVIKSPFRFDERSPFRFGEDPGCMVGRFGESLIPKGDPMEARLQEMLRYNMDKYANQNLDTLHIARRVRELLSIHNVGQRLFAKYVLGLSQGTVSELLSKPKPWDKLTEKGRDSYRKMHAWACDENAVLLLKSLIPKKGKDGTSIGVLNRGPESEMTEERIAHILSEASHMMKPQPHEDSRSNDDSKSPNHPQSSESPLGRDNSQNRRLKKYENDDISQEQVMRIYQEELAKLMGRTLEDRPFTGLVFPHFLTGGSGEDVRLAMDAYQREFAKLNSNSGPALQHPLAALHAQSLSAAHNGNVILPPEDIGGGSGAAAVSPLQRMASITNALISQPPSQHHHSPSQRPLKAVLPPITQQQFDQFNNLNTEEIVRKVKEQLSQFSISQRLFGESVLGLSQGSVSDLLARPKPWHMLTQKGREPFIRMKMFLEDENAVHKLVASQYKIAPEKLMRTGGYGVNPAGVPHSKTMAATCGKFGSNEAFLHTTPMHMQHSVPAAPPPVPPLTPPDMKKCTIPPQQCHTNPMQQYPSVKNLHHVSPTVYEMAALTQDLDTQSITTKIKEALLANNIGQKIFGEAVLGLSQGSVSELLSKPKPWHMLSIKGREPFIRMQLWLADSNNIDKLQAIKSERRELNKRRRGSGQQDNSSDTSSNDTSEFYHSSAGSPPSAKKHRVFFSEEQKEALRLAFALDPYPSLATIEFLANELSLVSRTITNWFHNHRMRLKQSPQGEQLNREGQGSGFDPVQFRILLSQRLGIPLPFGNTPFFQSSTSEIPSIRPDAPLRGEQGLDLSIKHEYEGDDNESHADSEDSFSGVPETRVPEPRISRRKPAAPQWVNPDWQQEPEVIINGVCVMQTEDFDREGREETVRIEPTPVPEEPSATPEPSSDPTPLESPKPSVSVKQETKDEKWDNPY
ncbi:hypothetical protein GE061_000619 [Apolygus lucorum]|uniref:Homeobox protein cut-like n=1 Tax=Apolygus lucorum TaxID=248454 RepID=A0A8S9Y6D0_APOLU|nr:hypothetical protein GE061_000619 [Apolygus lucorum]